MKTIRSIRGIRSWRKKAVDKGKIGFVPTMGALHEGHASLIRRAVNSNAITVVSIFVNPLQFGGNEDYEIYPKTWLEDRRMAKNLGVDVLFVPKPEEITPKDILTSVRIKNISEKLCGKYRPGHFTGVATIVTKLFNLVRPDYAYFGNKDYQQLQIIKKMVIDLNIPVRVTGMQTIREKTGLALSSRNTCLSSVMRKRAACIYRALRDGSAMIRKGEKSVRIVKNRIRKRIQKEQGFQIQYVSICHPQTLDEIKTIDGRVCVAIACFAGQTRLIDHVMACPC